MNRTIAMLAILVVSLGILASCAKKTPEEKLKDAVEAYQKGDPLGAIVLAHEILNEETTGPVVLQARWLLAQSYINDRQWGQAHTMLDAILDQTGLNDPIGQQAAFNKVAAFELSGQRPKALQQIANFSEGVTTGTPFWAQLQLRRAELLLKDNQLTTAQQVTAQILTHPQVPEEARGAALEALRHSYSTTETARAGIEYLETYLKDNPSTQIVPDVYLNMADLAKLIDDKESANRYYDEVLKALQTRYEQATGFNEQGPLIMRTAWTHGQKGDYEKGVALLEKTLEDFRTYPDRITMHYLIVRLYGDNKQYDKAIEVARRIQTEYLEDPRRVGAYFAVAEMLLSKKDYDGAGNEYRQVLSLFPGTEAAGQANMGIRRVEFVRRQDLAAAETTGTLGLTDTSTTPTTSPTTGPAATTAPAAVDAATTPIVPDAITSPTESVPEP